MSSPPDEGPTPRAVLAVLVVLTLLALWLRLDGIGRLLPHVPEPDNHSASQLMLLETGVPPAERPAVYGRYPTLLARLGGLVPHVGVAESAEPAQLEAHLRAASDVSLRLRIVGALLSVLAVPLTFLLARRFLAAWPALFAAALVASSLNHLMFSQQARPHGAHATFTLLALLACLGLARAPTTMRYLGAGAACALAATTLQTGCFTFLPLLAAHLFTGSWRDGARWARLAAAAALIAATMWAFYPGEHQPDVGATSTELEVTESTATQGGLTFYTMFVDGRGYGKFVSQTFEHDPVLLVLAGCGLLLLAARWRAWRGARDVWILAAHHVPYLGLWGLYFLVYERYWLPLYPVLAVLAAFALDAAVRRVFRKGGAKTAFVVAAVLALALPAFVVLRVARLARAPDTVREAAAWLREHARPLEDRILVTPQLNLPLVYAPRALVKEPGWKLANAWIAWQRAGRAAGLAEPAYWIENVPLEDTGLDPALHGARIEVLLEREKPRFVVVEAAQWTRWTRFTDALWRATAARGRLVFASSGPVRGIRSNLYQDVPSPIARILELDRLGPRIEIYALP